MIKQSLSSYIRLGEDIGMLRTLFGMIETRDEGGGISQVVPGTRFEDLTTHEKNAVRNTLTNVACICRELGLPAAQHLAEKTANDPPMTRREFNLIVHVFASALEGRLALCIPDYLEGYFESNTLVSDNVTRAFPLATHEIRAAGDCLAVGQPTAAVFHSMRAAEIGVRAMANALGAKVREPIELADWQTILNSISGPIQDIRNEPKSYQRDEDLAFFGEAASQFRFFKDTWRNRVAHARVTYTEQHAKQALDDVRRFFETISQRLKESCAL